MKAGFNAFDPHYAMSHEEIAAELGVTRQAVGQCERRALKKLRAALEAKGLTLEDFLRWTQR